MDNDDTVWRIQALVDAGHKQFGVDHVNNLLAVVVQQHRELNCVNKLLRELQDPK